MFVHIGLILLVVSVFTIGKAGANKCKCTSTYRHATLALSISSAQVSCARKTLAAIILRLLSVGRSCRCSNCVVHTARPPNCSLAPRTASTVGSVCNPYLPDAMPCVLVGCARQLSARKAGIDLRPKQVEFHWEFLEGSQLLSHFGDSRVISSQVGGFWPTP